MPHVPHKNAEVAKFCLRGDAIKKQESLEEGDSCYIYKMT